MADISSTLSRCYNALKTAENVNTAKSLQYGLPSTTIKLELLLKLLIQIYMHIELH